MEFNHIEYKKPVYKIKAPLREHLKQYSRLEELPITYEDLLRYDDLIPVLDDGGVNTLWYSVLYRSDEIAEQYMRQERVAMKKRYLAMKQRSKSLLRRMKRDKISTTENVIKLRTEFAHYHSDERFKDFTFMGEIFTLHLELSLGITVF